MSNTVCLERQNGRLSSPIATHTISFPYQINNLLSFFKFIFSYINVDEIEYIAEFGINKSHMHTRQTKYFN